MKNVQKRLVNISEESATSSILEQEVFVLSLQKAQNINLSISSCLTNSYYSNCRTTCQGVIYD